MPPNLKAASLVQPSPGTESANARRSQSDQRDAQADANKADSKGWKRPGPPPPPKDLGKAPGVGYRHVFPPQPTMPYAYKSLPDPRRPKTVAASTIRYRFAGKAPKLEQHVDIITKLRDQLYHAGVIVAPSDPVFAFISQDGKSQFIDLTYKSYVNYCIGWSAILMWKKTQLEWHSGGVFLFADHFVFSVSGLPTDTNLNKVLKFFRERFRANIDISDMWASFEICKRGSRTFLGDVSFLSTFRDVDRGDKYISGWVEFNGSELTLHFRGRGNACYACRSARKARHETSDCSKRFCHICRDRGHDPRDCSQRRGA